MKKLPLLLIAFLFGASNEMTALARDACTSLAAWQFELAGEEGHRAINVGLSLTDPIQELASPEGSYRLAVAADVVTQFRRPALYIPAVGGMSAILLNNVNIAMPVSDYAGVGPVLELPPDARRRGLVIEIRVAGDHSAYAGLWKGAPVICEFDTALEAQSKDDLWQRVLPNVMIILCLGLSALFLAIYYYTGKRFPVYLRFSVALLLWCPFFAFLSGFVRQLSYRIGTIGLFPARVTAVLGLLMLFYSYRGRRLSKLDQYAIAVIGSLIVPAIGFGITNRVTLQILCLGVSLLCQMPAVWQLLSVWRYSRQNKIFSAVAILTLSGEVVDFIKLIGPIHHLLKPMPYLARLTIPPTLLCSAAYFLWQFVQYYRETRKSEFRHRISGRLAMRLARATLSEESLVRLARAARRIHFARRGSVAKRRQDGNYAVLGVSGFDSSAIGSEVPAERHVHIAEAIRTGEIQVGRVGTAAPDRYQGNFSLAVPIPLRHNPDYLLLISDLSPGHQFRQEDLEVSRHFFTMLSGALTTTQERELREKKDHEFQDLVAKLEPDLFDFIQSSAARGSKITIDNTCERGIIFFDQKAYTTMLERLHPDRAVIALSHIQKWVGDCVLRYVARVKAFQGDAFLVEVYPLEGEERAQTISRTAKAAWHLAESIDVLNRTLIQERFPPITYRFGAHFGTAANVDVALVGTGTTTLIGDAVNLTQRIQTLAPPGSVYVSDVVAGCLSRDFVCESVGTKYVKGRSGLVSLFRLTGVQEMAAA